MNKNMSIWERNQETDPDYTKKATQRGGFTSISPQYLLMKATEEFGPYGKGFGFERCHIDTSLMMETGLVMVDAVFFYVSDGERFSFPINNAWQALGLKDKRPDAEFAKKAETNTLSKALSKLGFSADVYMGEYDDASYVAQLREDFALKDADEEVDRKQREYEEYIQQCEDQIKMLSTAVQMNELKVSYAGFIKKARYRKDDNHLKALKEAHDKRKAELEVKTNEAA